MLPAALRSFCVSAQKEDIFRAVRCRTDIFRGNVSTVLEPSRSDLKSRLNPHLSRRRCLSLAFTKKTTSGQIEFLKDLFFFLVGKNIASSCSGSQQATTTGILNRIFTDPRLYSWQDREGTASRPLNGSHWPQGLKRSLFRS